MKEIVTITVFPNVPILPFDEKSAEVYGKLKAKLVFRA